LQNYLIEGRIHGFAKRYARSLIRDIEKRFRVQGAVKYRPVPHLTLAGPFTTNNIDCVVNEINNIGETFEPVKFTINGFGHMDDANNRKVIYLKIVPSEELQMLRRELARCIAPHAELKPFDHDHNYVFHITIAFKDVDTKFRKIWEYITAREGVEIQSDMFRITLIGHRKILYEYDLVLKNLLNRHEALDRRLSRGVHRETITINVDSLDPRRVYFIGDHHFGHKNIIKYCNRGFRSYKHMDRYMKNKHNMTAGKHDLVVHLGDVVLNKGKRDANYWLGKLNGRIYLARGNHDRRINPYRPCFNQALLAFKNYRFMLSHRPEQVGEWNGWIIHGHHHNNHPDQYPLINHEHKTINVAVELLHYTPISLSEVIDKINISADTSISK